MTWMERGIWAALMAFWVIVLGFCVNKAVFGQEVPQQRGPLGIQPTAERIELGRKLFFDPRLSQDGTIACATCHDPNRGWSDGRTVAVGIRNQSGTRNSPTIINATYNDLVFWDGRTIGATTQALLPLVNPIEMGVQTEQQILRRLQLIPGYVALFANAFPPSSYDRVTGSPITGANLGLAVSSFESTVVSFNAPIDRYLAGEENALSADALVGYRIFEAAQCSQCHLRPCGPITGSTTTARNSPARPK
jgi:cytochrome c peroxidase